MNKFKTGDKVILINGQKGQVQSVNNNHNSNKNYYNVILTYDNSLIDVFASDIKLDK